MNRPKMIVFRFCTVLAVFALLTVLPGIACAKSKTIRVKADELAHPASKTLVVGSCPVKRAQATSSHCSRAQLLYPLYPKKFWLNRLIAQSVILPMFADVLGEDVPRLSNNESGGSRYKASLRRVLRKNIAHASGEAKSPSINFTAKLTGYGEGDISPAGQPRPKHIGQYLQFVFSYELSHEYEAHPPGPSGGFVVIDIAARKVLAFNDLIVPGQEQALENLQREAFRTWLKTERQLSDEAIEAHLADPTFAFHLSKDWRIAEDGLVFRFGWYEVGPRTFGAPEIFIAKHQLRDIVQPGIWERIP